MVVTGRFGMIICSSTINVRVGSGVLNPVLLLLMHMIVSEEFMENRRDVLARRKREETDFIFSMKRLGFFGLVKSSANSRSFSRLMSYGDCSVVFYLFSLAGLTGRPRIQGSAFIGCAIAFRFYRLN